MRRYPFGKFILEMPDDHKIIDIHKSAALYDRAYGLILETISRHNSTGAVIDIGANIGDTAAFFATYITNPIFCLEGNKTYSAYLKSNQRYLGDQVRLIEKFVRTEALSLLNLSYQGGSGTGAISIAEADCISENDFISSDKIIQITGNNIALIKSDTDGMDGFIIDDFLTKTEVPLFFECDTIAVLDGVPNPWPRVFNTIQKKDYSIIVFDNFGLPMLVEEDNPERILKDLCGYAHMQRAVHPIRIHYYDVWAFPRSWRSAQREIAEKLRADFLRPYRF